MSKVIFYTTSCPRCKVLEAKLKGANIEYAENNDVDLMLSKGLQAAPALEVDDKIMNFREAVEWINGREG